MADIADLTARPATFIAEQADVNTYHSNGEIEVEDEDALRYLQRFAWFDKELELSSLLDIGCRSGYVMRKAAKIWPDACVLGLDINELTLRHAPAPKVLGDAVMLPFRDDAFAYIFAVATFEHCWNAERAANEWLRVASRGVYVVTDLESEASCSHYSHTVNPFDWLELFDHPAWRLRFYETHPTPGRNHAAAEFFMERR
jgi:SAM-dependent methyltransferase